MNWSIRVASALFVLAVVSFLARAQCSPGIQSEFGAGVTTTYTVNSASQVVGLGDEFALVNVSNPAAPLRIYGTRLDGPVEDIDSIVSLEYTAVTPTSLYRIRAGLNGPEILWRTSGGIPGVFPAMQGGRAVSENGNFQYVAAQNGLHIFLGGIQRDHVSIVADDVAHSSPSTVWTVDGVALRRVTHNDEGRIAGSIAQYFFEDSQQNQYVPRAVLVVGVQLFVLTTRAQTGILWVFDIQPDRSLLSRGEALFPLAGSASRVRLAKNGSFVYACMGSLGTQVFNVSNPDSPNFVTSLGGDSDDRAMTLFGTGTGSRAYVASLGQGLRILDGGTLSQLGAFRPFPGEAQDVDIFADSYLVVADRRSGMHVYDIVANPGVPTYRGSRDFSGIATRVSTADWNAYFATGTTVTVVRFFTPTNPTVIGTFNVPGGETARDVLTNGLRLYVATPTTLHVYNIQTTPGAPPLMGSIALQTPFPATGQMGLGDSRVFVPTQAGVEVISINTTTGVPTRSQVLAKDADDTVISVASRFLTVPSAEFVAMLVRTPSQNGFYDSYPRAHLYTRRDFPTPRIHVRYGTWVGPGHSAFDPIPPIDRAISMQGSLLTPFTDDTVSFVDIGNLGSPQVLGTVPLASYDAGGIVAGATGVYAARGLKGVAALARSFNSAPQARFITRQPFVPPCAGGTVQLAASFAGSPPPSVFRWTALHLPDDPVVVDGVQPDGSIISGATTDTLTVSNVAAGPLWFACRAENVCGFDSVSSEYIELQPCCDPDYNQDGNVDQDDVEYLVNVVAGGANPSGRDPDFNRDGNVDQDDIITLVDVIAGGPCP
ncbi:MAG: hypothetical protein SFY69_05905 [Planctomycetota bacterium]|nr:hypothetical protein [Planctomycetota bacterium]